MGSPETVSTKIANVIMEIGIKRFDLAYGAGGQLQEDRFKTIDLY